MQSYLLRYGELVLKGRNRRNFVNELLAVLKPRLKILDGRFRSLHKKLIVTTDAPPEQVRALLSTIAGITSISPVYICSHDPDEIIECAWTLVKPFIGSGRSFSVRAKRPNKRFPIRSTELQTMVADSLYMRGLDLPVDLKNADLNLNISTEVHDTWLSVEKWPAMGGLPIQKRNVHGLLLSGGIDSPVAGYLIQKRGGQIQAIYFHTPPYTVEEAKDKVIELAQILSKFQNQLKLHIVSFTGVMKAIVADCDPSCMVVLSRRFMMRIATEIMRQESGHSIITGECLGQVASQTIENMGVIGEDVPYPILRPLIGMDKQEIIRVARRIGTYETSIQPFEDCCSLFAPAEPATRVSLRKIHRMESALKIDDLVSQALNQTETMILTPKFT